MKYLLDTCVISELVARNPNPRVVFWIDSADETSLYLSVITIGEIGRGIAKLPDSSRKARLSRWLEEDLWYCSTPVRLLLFHRLFHCRNGPCQFLDSGPLFAVEVAFADGQLASHIFGPISLDVLQF